MHKNKQTLHAHNRNNTNPKFSLREAPSVSDGSETQVSKALFEFIEELKAQPHQKT